MVKVSISAVDVTGKQIKAENLKEYFKTMPNIELLDDYTLTYSVPTDNEGTVKIEAVIDGLVDISEPVSILLTRFSKLPAVIYMYPDSSMIVCRSWDHIDMCIVYAENIMNTLTQYVAIKGKFIYLKDDEKKEAETVLELVGVGENVEVLIPLNREIFGNDF